MPDKECTTNLLELSFSLGQLRADKTKPREFLGEMSAILDGWECRKSGDDGDAFNALQKAIDSGSQGRGDNISKNQMDTIWKEYHSLMMAMGYLDLDLVGQPKRAPIPKAKQQQQQQTNPRGQAQHRGTSCSLLLARRRNRFRRL